MFESGNFSKTNAQKLWTDTELRRVPVSAADVAAIRGSRNPQQALALLYRTRLSRRVEG